MTGYRPLGDASGGDIFEPEEAGDGVSFLGVEQSITGRRWVGPGADLDRAAEALV